MSITVRFVPHDAPSAGTATTLDCETGQSLMQAAVAANVKGIEADCGGLLTCGTCHVYVAEDWLSRLPPIQPDEETILAFSDWREPNSRLSCQIKVTDELDGLSLTVAPED